MQWVIVALVKALNVVAIEALVTDLHPGTQRAHGRKFLDSEPDRLRCGRKTAIAQRLSCPSGDAINAVLAAAGYNFRRLLAWLRFLLLRILIALDLAAQLKLA